MPAAFLTNDYVALGCRNCRRSFTFRRRMMPRVRVNAGCVVGVNLQIIVGPDEAFSN